MMKRVFGVTGLSNSGKTTLIEKLIDCFRRDGYIVSSIKHTHHEVTIEQPGKDTWRLREAGAREVVLVGRRDRVQLHNPGNAAEPSLAELVESMAPCDLILVEGFKDWNIPKIEVFRPSLGRDPLWPRVRSVIAIASDERFVCPLPVLDLNRPGEIAAFIEDYCLARARHVPP
jgi:molybdopterin-guanine dinucleotide biosynthesis adapter protein